MQKEEIEKNNGEVNHGHNPEHIENSEFNYDKITDSIFIGNNQCCITVLSALLKRENIYADLSLEEISFDMPIGVGAYLWVPIEDHHVPDSTHFEITYSFIDEIVSRGKNIYVHCKNGHGRAPSIVINYLMKKNNISFKEAYDMVKSKRPVIHLSPEQKVYFENL